jgi:plastocyanin
MPRYLVLLIVVYVLLGGLVVAGSPLAAEQAKPNAPPSGAEAQSGDNGVAAAQPQQGAGQPNATQQQQQSQTTTAPAPDPPVAVAAGPGSVSIVDYSFRPATITVSAGDTVTWTNAGKQPHTATGSGFDTGILKTGQSGSHTFASPGTFTYICSLHPFMKGTVVVRAASSGGASKSGGGSSSGSTSGGGSSATGGSQGGSSSSSGAGSSSGSALPATGADAAALGGLGVLLLGMGLAIRRRAGLPGDGR